jgi:ribokinase
VGSRAPRIAVVGSCNIDVVAFVDRAPERGETIAASGSVRGPGGKGANQAIAAALLGGSVSFIGAVGADAMGDELRAALVAAGVDVAHLRTADAETGSALIVVEADGANRIVIVAGANASVTSLLPAERQQIADCDLLLVQLELPIEAIVEACTVARAAGTRVVLTPSPVRELPGELVAAVDVLVANELEAGQIGDAGSRVPDLVVTLGALGGFHVGTDGVHSAFASPIVDAVDTTAAGDTFVGALAVALGESAAWADALERASAAAAISVGRRGASASMPTRVELERFLGTA